MVVNAHTNTHAKDAERGTPVAVLTKGRERERERVTEAAEVWV